MENTAASTPAKVGPKPAWLRRPLSQAGDFEATGHKIGANGLHTVCASAMCPNRFECWDRRVATFLVGGNRCTRACRFCAVETGHPSPLDPDEPARVADAAVSLGLRHVVVTMVTRDDLHDGAAMHVGSVIKALRAKNVGGIVEVLVSDFGGNRGSLETVLAAEPDIFGHNLETVRRLTHQVRCKASYERSLSVLAEAKKIRPETKFKSGIMLGLGESENEVEETLRDIAETGCEMVTMGQYLQPTARHLPVAEWINPAKFDAWKLLAEKMGFQHVSSGPLVRSSYYADAVNLLAIRGRNEINKQNRAVF